VTQINLTFKVDASLQQVWEFGLLPARIPDWQFDILAVRDAPEQICAAGQSYTLVYRRFGRDLPSRVTVSRYEPPTTVQTEGKTPLGGYFRSTTCMQPDGGGTRVDWSMDYRLPGGPLGGLLDALIFRRAFEQTVRKYNENFKAVIEGRPAPHPPIRTA